MRLIDRYECGLEPCFMFAGLVLWHISIWTIKITTSFTTWFIVPVVQHVICAIGDVYITLLDAKLEWYAFGTREIYEWAVRLCSRESPASLENLRLFARRFDARFGRLGMSWEAQMTLDSNQVLHLTVNLFRLQCAAAKKQHLNRY